jgi:hypothetical protein
MSEWTWGFLTAAALAAFIWLSYRRKRGVGRAGMSLQDEIDKQIASERARLDKNFAKHLEIQERQNIRFRPMRFALEELIKAVDPAHLRVVFRLDNATVEVGQQTNNHFDKALEWEIVTRERGFSIEQTQQTGDYKTETYDFDTEGEVIQYLVTKMAPYLALYQHYSPVRKPSG